MSGTLSRADLVADLKASLHDAASVFTAAADGDFVRMLDIAAADFGRVRPRTVLGTLTLQAGVQLYDPPADLLTYKTDVWSGNRVGNPWEDSWPGRLPMVAQVENGGVRRILFSPAPTERQIALLGSVFNFFYLAAHRVDDVAGNTTILPGDRGLLLLRAQAEALREMAIRNSGKPVSLRDGHSGQPRNGTPSFLYMELMKEFGAAA